MAERELNELKHVGLLENNDIFTSPDVLPNTITFVFNNQDWAQASPNILDLIAKFNEWTKGEED